METAADGNGTVVPAQSINSGNSITVYAITRDASNNFVANVAATAWSLPTKTGGVVNGDLVPSGDSKSAAFTGHLIGTATIRATSSSLTTTDSGLLTVSAGTATQVRVETASDGSGTVVPAQPINSGNSITVYAITRDALNNFVANVAATAWSLPTKTGGVANGDLVPSGDSKSAVFTGHSIGTATIRATSSSLTTTDSGLLTVNAGTATKLAFTTQPGGGGGQGAWSQQPVVKVEDANGNTVTTSSASVTLAIGTNPGTPAGTLTCAYNPLNASAGVATFTYCSIDNAGSGYTLIASSGSLTPDTSSPFNIGAPTAVIFESLNATAQDGGVLLKWQTGREVANLGYHIYRDGLRITSSPVAGSALLAGPATVLTAGNSYAWFDPQGTTASHYDIEDLDLSGARTKHGPFLVDAVPASTAGAAALAAEAGRVSPLLSQLGRAGAGSDLAFTVTAPEPEAAPDAQGARGTGPMPPAPRAAASAIDQQYLLAAGPAVKLGVRHEGWYHVDASQLTAAGMPAGVDPQSLQLFAEGREQAMAVLGSGQVSAIEFYGTGLDTTFSDTRVYWLAWGSRQGRRVGLDNRQARGTAPASFTATVQWRPRTVYFAALVNGDADNFFGPSLDSTDPVTQPLTIANLNRAAAGSSELRVTMQGVTAGAHAVVVRLNGSELGSMRFSGQDNSSATFTVSNSLLQEGANTLALAAYSPGDVTVVDTVRLSYPHSYTAQGDYLRFTAPAGSPVTVGGFSGNQIQVVDITDPAEPLSLPGSIAAQGTGYAVSVAPPGRGNRTLLAFTAAQMSQPASISAHHPSSWHAAQAAADMVMVSHADFLSSLGPLQALRQAQGHTVAAMDVEDLYDEFNFGEQSPYAIKSFLSTANKVWKSKPRWVLLVGDATFDPRNYLGTGKVDYLPVELVGTSELETASDDWFADVNDDGNPAMAVGRLPVSSAAGAAALVKKIAAYENAGAAPWKNKALLVSGAGDSGDPFESYTAAVQALVPSLSVTTILQAKDANSSADFLAAFNGGQGLVNYIGHGSTEVWQSGMFDSAAAATTANGSSTPVVLSMTCLNGYFQDVYTYSLAKALLGAPGGGAVAVWASSSLTYSAPQSTLNQSMIKAMYGASPLTIGEAALAAKQTVGDPDVRRTWILLGDPAMKLQ